MASLLALIAATIAAGLNLSAWWLLSHRDPSLRRYRAEPHARLLVGLFALFYVAAFFWLASGSVSQGDWSRTLIWIAPLAFLGPWMIDAIGVAVYVAGKKKALDDYHATAGSGRLEDHHDL